MPKSAYWQNIAEQVQTTGEPFFSLAPMEAVTDAVFRQVVQAAAAPDIYYTEFTNAKSVTHPKAKFSVAGRLYVSENEAKMPIAQLWGDEGEDFYKAAVEAKKMGYEAIDLNMGCPDATVIKNGGGSDMIRHFERAAEVIAATKKAGLPVSVKTRLGFNDVNTFREWLPFLFQQDVEVLTIHLRSRKEMSKVDAHYEYIDEIVALRDEHAPETLLQINGDIKTRQQGLALAAAHPGVDGVMIGRGIFESPFAFEKVATQHSLVEMLTLLRLQLDLYDEFVAQFGKRKFDQLKRFFKIYVRNIPHAAGLREQLMASRSTDEVREILDRVSAAGVEYGEH